MKKLLAFIACASALLMTTLVPTRAADLSPQEAKKSPSTPISTAMR